MSDAVARGGLSPWDERIPLITDENYGELIVNETLTAQEERERIWFLIVYVSPFRFLRCVAPLGSRVVEYMGDTKLRGC